MHEEERSCKYWLKTLSPDEVDKRRNDARECNEFNRIFETKEKGSSVEDEKTLLT